MKNKRLAIFGIIAYILSVLSSATDLEGNSTAPPILIVIAGVVFVTFIVMATLRLWKEAKNLSIILVSSAFLSFVFMAIQTVTSPSYGSPVIVLLNIIKITAALKLFCSPMKKKLF